jgi:hypothetical protein
VQLAIGASSGQQVDRRRAAPIGPR